MYEFVGQNIRFHRERQGLSRENLTEISGVSSNHIGLIERSVKMPRIDTLHKLCDALNISIFDAIYGETVDKKDINFQKIVAILNEMNTKELEATYVIMKAIRDL